MKSILALSLFTVAVGLVGCTPAEPAVDAAPGGTSTASSADIDPVTGTAAIESDPAPESLISRTKWSYDEPSAADPNLRMVGAYVKQADGSWHQVVEGIDPIPYTETDSTLTYVEMKSDDGEFVIRLYGDHADSRKTADTEFKKMANGSW